jgi:tRNA pseudouridine55 synthase
VNGVLVIDKPPDLSSHDIVLVARRALGERRIGHTGTLDPMATGVLPLACGAATRLVRFLAASDKEYEATIRFGVTTDTYDITGEEVSRSDDTPGRHVVMRALQTLTGNYNQRPPAYSAKKVEGERAYRRARRREDVELTPVPVRVSRADLIEFDGREARVAITCSAGFYVRTFAHALGETAGTGACLAGLRRTRSGEFRLEQALSLQILTEGAAAAAAFLIPVEQLLSDFPWARVTDEGVWRVSHGQIVTAREIAGRGQDAGEGWVRVLDDAGQLVAVATPGAEPGTLHPAIVLR